MLAAVIYLVGFPALTVWMLVAAALAGAMMRAFHYDAVGTRSFVLVRRYGLLGAVRWFLCKIRSRRVTIRGKLEIFLNIIVVPMLGAVAAISFPAIVLLSVVSPGNTQNSLSDGLSRVIVLTGSLAAVVSSWVWLRGLSFIAKPHVKRGLVPGLRVPRQLERRYRDRLAVDFFWSQHVVTACAFAGAYPLLVVVPTLVAVRSSPSSTPPVAHSGIPILPAMLLMLLAMAPLLVPALAAGSRIERRFAGTRAAVKLCNILCTLDPSEVNDLRQSVSDSPHTSVEARRKELAHVGELLHVVAGQIDAQQPRGFTPHPTATVFRGVLQALHQYLRSLNAYDDQMPANLFEMLHLTLLVLLNTCNVNSYKALAALVSAFDDAGSPSVELFAKPPSRLARLYEQTTATITRTQKLFFAVIGLAVPVTAVYLAISGKIDIESLLRLLK